MASRCCECGAPLAAGETCIDHVYSMLLLEREVDFKPPGRHGSLVQHQQPHAHQQGRRAQRNRHSDDAAIVAWEVTLDLFNDVKHFQVLHPEGLTLQF